MRWHGPAPAWRLIDVAELWRFRELIWAFGFRDLKVRYRQAVIGIAWAIIQPLCTVIVFGVLISLLRGTASGGDVPYAVTSLCGLVPWQFFAAAVSQATLSIALNNQLIQKVYFPRVILPLSAFVPALVDFAVAFAMLGIVMLYYGILPGWQIVLLPVLFAMTAITAAAFSLWFSALNGIYRDVQFAVPFILQLGMIVCPVVYETGAVIPEKWQPLYYLNPTAGLLQCYRSVLLGSPWPSPVSLAISVVMVGIIGIGGAAYFRRMERRFADVS
ncbi:Teichoic acid translocation permease protein TagG [Rubripirellula obstinata]|uniref:Transport permease protein n=1 Tax=Rubripirellula obstinata TaxID=406547 RepID=A0A5B1CIA0_9BACT|nr:Teichoic acid translocation permease protein TagG [Rubripirellula obstinata]